MKKLSIKPKVANKQVTLTPRIKKIIWIVLAIVLALLLTREFDNLNRYKRLGSYPNLACVGIGVALRDGLDIKHYDFEAKVIADNPSGHYGGVGQHKCTTGTVITDSKSSADGSGYAEGYQLGADVLYFKDAAAAYRFAEETANPSRSWGVDEAGSRSGIKQDKTLFTYIVTDVAEPYFEAYTVRDNAAINIQLPCAVPADPNADLSPVFDACDDAAQRILKTFADSVQNKLQKEPLF